MEWDEWEERMYEEYCDKFNNGEDLDDDQIPQFKVWLEKHCDDANYIFCESLYD